jgi:tetratricopeptide (TPR) repeat protein
VSNYEKSVSKEFAMIGMDNINRLFDFMRRKDWAAAHAMLDEIELTDPDMHGLAHWRSVVLREEGRYEDALQYLADNLHRFNCKTSVFHKRAWIFRVLGNDAAALNEIEKAPFDAEIDDYWALVMEAKFFRLHLMATSRLPIPPEQWAEIPDDYISLLPTGERVSKQQIVQLSERSK